MDAPAVRRSTSTKHAGRRARAAGLFGLALAVAALLSALVAAGGAAAQRDLDRAAARIAASVGAHVDDAAALATTTRGLFHIDPEPSAREFTAFVAAANTPSAVPGGRQPDVAFVDGTPGSARAVVTHATTASVHLLDVDVGALPAHRAALDAARDTGRTAMTDWGARLPHDPAGSTEHGGVATLYAPVYRVDRVPETVAARRAAILGWTSTRLDATALLGEAGVEAGPADEFTLYAGAPSARALVHTSRETLEPTGPHLTSTQTLMVHGREWTIVASRPDTATVVVSPLRGFLLLVALATAALAPALVAGRRGARPPGPQPDEGPRLDTDPQPANSVASTAAPVVRRSPTATDGDPLARIDAARLSHELRTPLNSVLGLATLMRYDELSAVQRDRLLTLHHAGRHLLAILDDHLENSDRAAGHPDARQTPFRVGAVIEQVVAAYTQIAQDKHLELRSQTDARLGLVVGDASQLRRMLQHLVDNAVAATERGGVDVTAELVDRTEDRCTIRIAVRDTGRGIDPEIQRRLLAPHTSDDPAPWEPGSEGLGLAICRQVADRLGGTLDVVATRGRGTTISCTVELGVLGHGAENEQSPGDPQPSAPRSGADVSPTRILLVEDDDINQVVARGMLEQLGCNVDVAADGIEAVEALRERTYDAVLMDCGLPRLDGYSTTEHVRAMEAADRRTPIIAMTAAALERDRQRCLDVGMDDHLSKPVTMDELAAALARAGAVPSTAPAPSGPN